MDAPTASGHNKQYHNNEEQLLILLKTSGLSWRQIEIEYNKNVAEDRRRTATALENKWRQLLNDYLPKNQ
ncbi:hypothetical protein BDW72DRAFT_197319 [Aspergillus terricola var. indicus]